MTLLKDLGNRFCLHAGNFALLESPFFIIMQSPYASPASRWGRMAYAIVLVLPAPGATGNTGYTNVIATVRCHKRAADRPGKRIVLSF